MQGGWQVAGGSGQVAAELGAGGMLQVAMHVGGGVAGRARKVVPLAESKSWIGRSL